MGIDSDLKRSIGRIKAFLISGKLPSGSEEARSAWGRFAVFARKDIRALLDQHDADQVVIDFWAEEWAKIGAIVPKNAIGGGLLSDWVVERIAFLENGNNIPCSNCMGTGKSLKYDNDPDTANICPICKGLENVQSKS